MRHVTCNECGTFYRRLQYGKVLPCPICAKPAGLTEPKKTTNYSPLYLCWLGIKRRCLNEANASYPDYGGRGITVCERWANSFEAFERDMGDRPIGHSIERKDNDGDYEPSNCIWATAPTQNRNRRSNIRITMHDRTQVLTDWCAEYSIDFNTVSARLKRGWSPTEALTTPVSKYTLKDIRKLQRLRKSSPAREVELCGAQKPQT